MRSSRILIALAVGGALGLALFAFLARQATRIQDAAPPEAQLRFSTLRDTLEGRSQALVWVDPEGALQHRVLPVGAPGEKKARDPRTFGVLAYRAREERLVEITVPFWFVRLKEPALRFALREADFEWGDLGLSASELRRAGPGLVMDEQDFEGNQILIWLE